MGPNQSELTGYNVKRHEFDPEYDQDAELLIAELEFREEDTPVRPETMFSQVPPVNPSKMPARDNANERRK